MKSMPNWAGHSARPERKVHAAQHFPATFGQFDDPADRATIDDLVRWAEEQYR